MSKSDPGTSRFQNLTIYAILFNLALSVFLIVWNFSGDSSAKIAFVDTVKLLKDYKGMESARQELTSRSDAYKANLDTLRMEFDRTVAEMQASKNASAKEKQLMEELINAKRQEYLNYEQVAGEQVQKQDQEMSAKLLERVNDYIKRYGESNGYKIILAATPYGNIAYGAEVMDITEEVLVGLNKEYSN